jgi:phosphatidylglycerol---prolipoprotein diacylglyceryl transferase
VLDCAAPAAALAMGIHGIGAFLAGLDYGVPTALPWGVTYTSLISVLWYRTPLGLRLHPVQLYDAAASLLILVVLAWWLPRRRQNGELAGAWLLLTGLSSSLLSLFRAGSGRFVLFESLAVAAVLAGGALLLKRAKFD